MGAKTLATEEKIAHKKEGLKYHFSEFESATKKYGIDPADIYK